MATLPAVQCRAIACLLLIGSNAGAVSRFVSPMGQDAPNAGAINSPCRTIAYAVAASKAGDEVLLLDGDYAGLSMACDGGFPADIAVKAVTERKPRVALIRLEGCRGWKIEGLQFAAVPGQPDPLNMAQLHVLGGDGVSLRRNLFTDVSPSLPLAAMSMLLSGDNHVVEENEVLDFSNTAIFVGSNHTVVRRNFLVAGNVNPGVLTGIDVTGSTAWVENNVIEGARVGIAFHSLVEKVSGNLIRGGMGGVFIGGAGVSSAVVHTVAIALSGPAIEGNNGASLKQLTLQSATIGVQLESGTATNLEATEVSAPQFANGVSGTVAGNTWNTTDAGGQTGVLAVTPSRGGCYAYPPEPWPFRTLDGGPVGAVVRNRYDKGTLTNESLWKLDAGGQFPCGAVVPGVNNTADRSCTTAHLRFGVNLPACPLRPNASPPRFVSVPPDTATCGETFTYVPRVEGSAAFTIETHDGFTLEDGGVTWAVPQSGSGTALLTATSANGIATQEVKVAVLCAPPVGCGCSGTSAFGCLALLAWVLRRRW